MIKKVIPLIVLFSLLGCKKEKQETSRELIYVNEGMSFIFDFPDTVIVNKEYNGRIIYKNILDTLTTDLSNHPDSIKTRYIIYSLAKTKDLRNYEKSLKKIAIDTFGAIDYRTIPLFKIKFTEKGVNFIDGFITDSGYIDLPGKDSVRVISDEFRISHKVVVIDK
jgi:hypothetical protein